jgi:hypothetical protein
MSCKCHFFFAFASISRIERGRRTGSIDPIDALVPSREEGTSGPEAKAVVVRRA